MTQLDCTHANPNNWVMETVDTAFGPVEDWVNRGGQSMFVDISIGAFQCAQCGHIGYYTGQWRKYYEDDIPCPGSYEVNRSAVTSRLYI